MRPKDIQNFLLRALIVTLATAVDFYAQVTPHMLSVDTPTELLQLQAHAHLRVFLPSRLPDSDFHVENARTYPASGNKNAHAFWSYIFPRLGITLPPRIGSIEVHQDQLPDPVGDALVAPGPSSQVYATKLNGRTLTLIKQDNGYRTVYFTEESVRVMLRVLEDYSKITDAQLLEVADSMK